ncbi:hypothetical protein BC739_004448 [Kutzneria viridogrisea]|uniref:Secreted protein n=2 Tax=Kutzneria TaxID=43356 RepID=A0ABR6BK21_9PSEU|nr:hypothetical protein [Kutzneria albida]AHH95399.1 putative secreted protein [Kutzneria albida DSM 43870]MBA8927242.1 hypothetical protein [Kutzneria viridogrisea]
MPRLARSAGLAAALLAGAAAPVLAAAPAHAATQDCLQYLIDKHAPMTQEVVVGCSFGTISLLASCTDSMEHSKVPHEDAVEACRRAADLSQHS